MKRYNPKELEPKWQQMWAESKIYEATEDPTKPKRYVLEYFPYPSGAAMHVGHVRNYTIGDAVARFHRMQGENVLHPMGWDAFGLPAENYAIKNNISPRQAIAENTDRFRKQLTQMGFSYDWSREIDSSDPKYYRWTQWFFKLLFERGLAYRKESLVNWDPIDKTVLANEQVIDGKAERSGAVVEKLPLAQWFFKITDYADRLVADLDKLDWSDSIKSMQRNWIGRSKGMVFTAPVKDTDMQIQTFSAHFEAFRADTFVVIAPDHLFLKELVAGTPEEQKVLDFAAEMVEKRDSKGYTDEESVDGIFTGRYIVDPVGNGDLPIWVASYALSHYGTGIVKCSAHDERDFRFAKKYDIPLKPVLFPKDEAEADKVRNLEVCYSDMKEGILLEPEVFKGKTAGGLRDEIINYLENEQLATSQTSYKIRDWLISRQRYWGAPIPMIWVDKATITDASAEFIVAAKKHEQIKIVEGKELIAIPVPDEYLPVKLPEVDSYKPDGSGKGPLARSEDWVHVWMSTETGEARPFSDGRPSDDEWVEGWRETDTMDGFACSSWYFLRFADPHNDNEPFSREMAKFWLPVDDYIGGAEHAVMHLLYARMWTKVMFDAGLIEFDEPFKALRNHGMILAPDGRKMSKSWGNVIAPDEIIEQGYGADAIRVMELFIGPWDQSANWSIEGMGGCYRFLNRVWVLTQEHLDYPKTDVEPSNAENNIELSRSTHTAIKRVTKDLHSMGFNTAIAALMEFVNELYKLKNTVPLGSRQWRETLAVLAQLLAPFAPHIAEELWHELGNDASVHISSWPVWDDKLLETDTVTIVVQINGKRRGELQVNKGANEADVVEAIMLDNKLSLHLVNEQVKKTVYVPNRLVNFVV
ncbi:MAG: leucine--tRNA ligase [Candidatus Saccharimonadales bacterium]